MEGLGFASVSTIASFESESSKTEFKATAIGDTLVAKEELDPWLERIKLPSIGDIVLSKGSRLSWMWPTNSRIQQRNLVMDSG